MLMRTRSTALLVALLIVGVGCGGGGRLTYQSAQDAYQKGQQEYENGDYQRAIRYFRAVFQYGRGNEWADDAQYYLGAAYREQGRHLLAANEFKRYLQLYRNSERAPQVEYERAMAYYALSPQYQLDQTDTRTAISHFQLFIERYPNHEKADNARKRIAELRAKLARKKLAAAELYETREMWSAATETYEDVFDQYPDTPWADDALLGAIRSYIEYADRSVQNKQDDRLQQAIDHYNRLAQVFQDSPLLKRAEDLYAEARSKLDAIQQAQDDESLASDSPSNN